MQQPTVVTEVKDTANRVLWKIWAYRTVTAQEARIAITAYARKHGKPAPNKQIEVLTTIGLHG